MDKIFIIIFSIITFHCIAQDTIRVNLINANSEQPLTTANAPNFRVFTKNQTNETWLILENIRYTNRLEWLWTVEIEDEKGQIFIKKADWTIVNDDVDKSMFKTKVIFVKPKNYLNAELHLFSYLNDFLFDNWQYYNFKPGKYKVRLTYELPLELLQKIRSTIPKPQEKLTTKVIQTNWLNFEIIPSTIHFSTDFQSITTEKVENPYLNWMKQLTIIQNGKHIKEQLFDTHNHLIAEFVPTEPTDQPTLINLYSGKQFEIKNNDSIDGKFRHYVGAYHGVNKDEFWEVMRTEGNILNGQLDGTIYSYEPFGSYSKRITHYKNGEPNGHFEQWQRPTDSTEFVLREKGFYNNGLLHNEYIEYYHETGKMFRKLCYDNGLVDGKTTVYHKNGQKMLVTNYLPIIKAEKAHLKDNRLLAGKLCHDTQIKSGVFANYDTLGNITQKRRYKNDKPVGKHFHKITLDGKTYLTKGFYKNAEPWKGQFIINQSHTTRSRYGVERTYKVYRLTYKKGKIIKEEILKEGEGWLF